MKKIHFVCVHNSCRSQMAEAFAREYGKGIIEVQSGGTESGHKVDSLAIQVMKEVDIDISNHTSKRVNDWSWADRIIIMGCDAEGACPAIFLPKVENWDLENPKGKDIGKYREVRDKIKQKIKKLIEKYKED